MSEYVGYILLSKSNNIKIAIQNVRQAKISNKCVHLIRSSSFFYMVIKYFKHYKTKGGQGQFI